MEKEIELFRGELKKIHLRVTSQRLKIVEAFLKTEKHITCDELYLIVRRNHPDIGYTTVYRTLKLIQETGFSKVQMTRILDRMEGRKIIERKRRGMTNVIILH